MIYFDNAATTKPCPETVAAVNHYLTDVWANPSSLHSAGIEARRAVEDARRAILSSLGVRFGSRSTVVFTGSGTEANNLAILGTCRAKARRGRVIITEGEHSSVENAARRAEEEGHEVVRIPTRGGRLDMDALAKALTPNTVLLSLMLVNNETGARYDVEGAFKIAKETVPGAVLHCDAVQGYMKVPFTAASLGADLITVSAHKIHGPKGVGALFIKDDIIRAKKISPIIYGGGHEGGLRSGTENVPAILGFAAALKASGESFAASMKRCSDIREHIINTLKVQCPDVKANIPSVAAPHILSLTVPGIKSETMLNYLSSRGICVSSGSACSSHGKPQSRALAAFGLSAAAADTTIRLSFSGENTIAEADEFIAALKDGIKNLCKI